MRRRSKTSTHDQRTNCRENYWICKKRIAELIHIYQSWTTNIRTGRDYAPSALLISHKFNIVNTLIEAKFKQKKEKREKTQISMKKILVKAMSELAKLFKCSSLRPCKCLLWIYFDENVKFFSIYSKRKRKYKQIEDYSELKDKKDFRPAHS